MGLDSGAWRPLEGAQVQLNGGGRGQAKGRDFFPVDRWSGWAKVARRRPRGRARGQGPERGTLRGRQGASQQSLLGTCGVLLRDGAGGRTHRGNMRAFYAWRAARQPRGLTSGGGGLCERPTHTAKERHDTVAPGPLVLTAPLPGRCPAGPPGPPPPRPPPRSPASPWRRRRCCADAGLSSRPAVGPAVAYSANLKPQGVCRRLRDPRRLRHHQPRGGGGSCSRSVPGLFNKLARCSGPLLRALP